MDAFRALEPTTSVAEVYNLFFRLGGSLAIRAIKILRNCSGSCIRRPVQFLGALSVITQDKIKIFRAEGPHGIAELEGKISNWVRRRPDITIVDQDATLGINVDKSRDGEIYQQLTVTLWYAPPLGAGKAA
ncbi:MAG: hypothetical protein ABI216_02705 [Devosia sp.]